MESIDPDEWQAVLLCCEENSEQLGDKRPRSGQEEEGEDDESKEAARLERKKCREKKRRQEVNERFDDLVEVLTSLHPGDATKKRALHSSCRSTVLAVAVETIKTLAQENMRYKQQQLLMKATSPQQPKPPAPEPQNYIWMPVPLNCLQQQQALQPPMLMQPSQKQGLEHQQQHVPIQPVLFPSVPQQQIQQQQQQLPSFSSGFQLPPIQPAMQPAMQQALQQSFGPLAFGNMAEFSSAPLSTTHDSHTATAFHPQLADQTPQPQMQTAQAPAQQQQQQQQQQVQGIHVRPTHAECA